MHKNGHRFTKTATGAQTRPPVHENSNRCTKMITCALKTATGAQKRPPVHKSGVVRARAMLRFAEPRFLHQVTLLVQYSWVRDQIERQSSQNIRALIFVFQGLKTKIRVRTYESLVSFGHGRGAMLRATISLLLSECIVAYSYSYNSL